MALALAVRESLAAKATSAICGVKTYYAYLYMRGPPGKLMMSSKHWSCAVRFNVLYTSEATVYTVEHVQ